MSIKFREHKETWPDSLATLVELPNLEALEDHVGSLGVIPDGVNVIIIKGYSKDPDTRIDGWNQTWIVTAPGMGIIGYTNGRG